MTQSSLAEGHHDIVANILDCDIVESSNSSHAIAFIFELIPLGRVWTPIIPPPSYRLNSTTSVLLQGWLWHQITHKGWYVIKQSNQTKVLFSDDCDQYTECLQSLICPGYSINLYPVELWGMWSYPLIVITHWTTLTQSDCTCLNFTYGSKRSVWDV